MSEKAPATLLIVEDSASDRENYKRFLLRNLEHEFRFIEAAGGEEALSAVRLSKPDCVLLDYSLPDSDGLQVLSTIQALPAEQRMPVIMLTGQGTADVAVRAMREGAADYLIKDSIGQDSLNAAVNAALRASGAKSPVPTPRFHVLIVDDSPTDTERYRRLLGQSAHDRFTFSEAQTAADGLEAFHSQQPDCVLLDYNLPDFEGLEFLQTLAGEQSTKGRPMPVIVMLTGQGSEAVAVEAMKRGAQDYLVKDTLSRDNLARSVTTAIEKHRLQRRLIDKEREFEQFCYAVAHDLQAPLRRTRQFCALLHKSSAARLDPSGQQFLQFIESNIDSLQQLLKDLLNYYSSDRLPGGRGSVDMNVIAAAVRDNLAEDLRSRGAVLSISSLPVVQGYASALTQLLQNLIDNAIKYNRSAAPSVAVGCEEGDRVWIFSVKDNGIGIERSALQRIFEPFQRAVSSEDFPGTGLGLAICDKLVKLHGGQIWMDSSPGKGTICTFLIPREPAA